MKKIKIIITFFTLSILSSAHAMEITFDEQCSYSQLGTEWGCLFEKWIILLMSINTLEAEKVEKQLNSPNESVLTLKERKKYYEAQLKVLKKIDLHSLWHKNKTKIQTLTGLTKVELSTIENIVLDLLGSLKNNIELLLTKSIEAARELSIDEMKELAGYNKEVINRKSYSEDFCKLVMKKITKI